MLFWPGPVSALPQTIEPVKTEEHVTTASTFATGTWALPTALKDITDQARATP